MSESTPPQQMSVNNQRAKRPKIQVLATNGVEDIQRYLFEVQHYSTPNDKYEDFLSPPVYEYVEDELRQEGKAMTNDNIVQLLENIVKEEMRLNMGHHGMEFLRRHLKWPTKGSTTDKIRGLFLQAHTLLKQIPDSDELLMRAKINRAIISVVPREFEIDPSVADLAHYRSLRNLQDFVLSRAWKKVPARTEKIHRLGRTTEDDLLAQAVAVAENAKVESHETLTVKIDRLEQQNQDLQNKISELHNKQGSKLEELVPMLLGMLISGNQQSQQNGNLTTLVQALANNFSNPPTPYVQRRQQQNPRNTPIGTRLNPQDYGLPHDAVVYDTKRTGAATDCVLKAFNPNSAQYEIVNGVLDSGAYTTVGNLRLHGHFCKRILPVTKSIHMKLANGAVVPAVKAGVVDLVAEYQGKSQPFSNVFIFLVDSEGWSEILIGRPTLRKHRLLPEHHLTNSSTQQSGTLQPPHSPAPTRRPKLQDQLQYTHNPTFPTPPTGHTHPQHPPRQP